MIDSLKYFHVYHRAACEGSPTTTFIYTKKKQIKVIHRLNLVNMVLAAYNKHNG